MSDNIQVRSVVGRFLEHSRVFWFDAGGNPEVWIGSADLMHRNLDRRVEALVRVCDQRHVDELARLLDAVFAEDTASWHLASDGSWERRNRDVDGNPLRDLQEEFIGYAQRRRQDVKRRG